MDKAHLVKMIEQGEGISVEFKKSRMQLNKDVFKSVCAFMNRNGGHLFLGVEDNGNIAGIDESAVASVFNSFVTAVNNPQKLFPTFYLSPQVVDFDGRKVIYVFIPESSQVHRVAGKIFDRNDDGDFDVTDNASHVTQLYIRKETTYSENTIYPYARIQDLRADLIERVRIRAKSESGGSHPWFEMDDEMLLKSAQLYKKDL